VVAGADDSYQIPDHGRFDTLTDYRSAIDRAIRCARRHIRVFERNLQDCGFNDPQRHEALNAFLLNNRDNRLQIVLHDVDYVQRYCPRTLSLLSRFSHAVSIHRTTQEARGVYDGIIVADDAHYIHRFHFDQPRGDWVCNDIGRTQPLLRRFEEIWGASFVAVPATTLGL